MITFEYDPEKINIIDFQEKLSQGLFPVCPKCGGAIEIVPPYAVDKSTRGMYCSVDPAHLSVKVNVANDILSIFKKSKESGSVTRLDAWTDQDRQELDQEVAGCRLHPEEGKSWEETKKELNALRGRR